MSKLLHGAKSAFVGGVAGGVFAKWGGGMIGRRLIYLCLCVGTFGASAKAGICEDVQFLLMKSQSSLDFTSISAEKVDPGSYKTTFDLPGASACFVAENKKIYSCYWETSSADKASSFQRQVISDIKKCDFYRQKVSEKSIDFADEKSLRGNDFYIELKIGSSTPQILIESLSVKLDSKGESDSGKDFNKMHFRVRY